MIASAQAMIDAANALVPHISPEDAQRLIAERGALMLDVRGPDEVAQSGRLAGAINIPFGETAHRADPASPHHLAEFRKDRPVILYCVSGRRSALDGHALKQLGYEEVYNLGGFLDSTYAGWAVDV